MPDQTVSVRIRLEDTEDLLVAREAAEENGVDFQTPGGDEVFEPVTAILVGTAVLALGKAVYTWWERRRGGLVIDLRDQAPDQLYRDRDVPWGLIVVFAKDGKITIEAKDEPKDAVQQLIETVVKSAFESARDIAKAAAQALGEDKVKSGGGTGPAAVEA